MFRKSFGNRMLFTHRAPPPKPKLRINPHEDPVALPATYTPYPLPKYDEVFGYGPSRIDVATLPDVPSLEETKLISMSNDEESADTVVSIKDVAEPATKMTATPNYEVIDGMFMGQQDMRRPLVRRLHEDAPSQLQRYRSARTPRELLADWKDRQSQRFQDLQCIYTRADIVSALDDFSNAELAEVLTMMTEYHTPGRPFLSKSFRRTALTSHDIVLPDPTQHGSHFTFLRSIEEHCTTGDKCQERLVNDSQFLATILRTFSCLRSDDATTNYERFAQRKVFLSEKCAISNWTAGCGHDLFRVGQSIVLAQVESIPFHILEQIVCAVIAMPSTMWSLPMLRKIAFWAVDDAASCPPESLANLVCAMSLGNAWPSELLQVAVEKCLEASSSPSDKLLLALGSILPTRSDLVIKVWHAIPQRERTAQTYKYLFDVLCRTCHDETAVDNIVTNTVGTLDHLDDVLLRSLPYMEHTDFSQKHGLTVPEGYEFVKQSYQTIQMVGLDTLRLRHIPLRNLFQKQQSGSHGVLLTYSTLRALHEETHQLKSASLLKKTSREVFDMIAEEYRYGNVVLCKPSDELALCREAGSYGTEAALPYYAALFLTRRAPLVKPVIISHQQCYHNPLDFPIFVSIGVHQQAWHPLKELYLEDPRKCVVHVERPQAKPVDVSLTQYDTFIDRRVESMLRNELATYSRSRHLDNVNFVTDRPGYYNFIDDVRRAGYAPSSE